MPRLCPVLPTTLVGVALVALPALAQDRWDERLWNYQPAAQDLILPMPCGGAMAFRPILVRGEGDADNYLADRQFMVGFPEDRTSYSEYVREAHVAGSFSVEGDPGARLYYIGKYEVTADQFATLMEDTCPGPSVSGALPVQSLSWFEAVDFARAYSEWLLADARDALPFEDGVPGFIRLPTEAEWEFAARGGMAVTDTQREDRVFPTGGRSIDAFAWYAAPNSCDGSPQVVGLREPNPLGLHDVIGNVREIVLEPFRMTRGGRLHGQIGGFISRGGSCATRGELLRTADREEHFFFDPATGQPTRPEFTGLRVALAAPIETSFARVERYRADWSRAREARIVLDTREDPVAALEALAELSRDPDVGDALRRIASDFANEMQVRNSVDARAAQTAITAAVQLIRLYTMQTRLVEQLDAAIAACDGSEACAAPFAQSQERRASARETTRNVLLDLLRQTVRDYDQDLLRAQLRTVQDQYRTIGGPLFEGSAALFVDIAADRRGADPPGDEEIMQTIRELLR